MNSKTCAVIGLSIVLNLHHIYLVSGANFGRNCQTIDNILLAIQSAIILYLREELFQESMYKAMENDDRKTREYFNLHLTEYPLERMEFALSTVMKFARPDSSLVDIGCGTGNLLEQVRAAAPLQTLAGIDNSVNYLSKTRERVPCTTFQGSILDRDFIESIPDRFDFAVLGAVLHHLIGRTRRHSRKLAMTAMRNSLSLLKPGGILLIVEPVFYPSILMDTVFYVKKILSRIIPGRIELRHGHNIGAPVVSYFTNEQLIRMIGALEGASLIDSEIREKRIGAFPASILKRTNTTLVIRKNTEGRRND